MHTPGDSEFRSFQNGQQIAATAEDVPHERNMHNQQL